ncbi:MAG: hypothetical protein BWY52_01863 [Chloroflexi bacterium ADurb.Bin325]|nr:MAG: hypothetical protein BWY52_01863 [Chloroflexi bacterium ADurb.Bin325]
MMSAIAATRPRDAASVNPKCVIRRLKATMQMDQTLDSNDMAVIITI